MIVVADTSPLNYLILIDAIDVLPALYGSVVISTASASEMRAPGAPAAVAQWIARRHSWAEVANSQVPNDPRLIHLDAGEREAIRIALERNAALVLMDDRKARLAAESCGLIVAGTLRVLADASREGLIDLDTAVTRLRRTSFRADFDAILSLLKNR